MEKELNKINATLCALSEDMPETDFTGIELLLGNLVDKIEESTSKLEVCINDIVIALECISNSIDNKTI